MAEICEDEYAKLFFLKHLRESIPTVHRSARWIAMGSMVLRCPHVLPAQHDPSALKKCRTSRGAHERRQVSGKQSLFPTRFFMS
jgi:hypothetical protein